MPGLDRGLTGRVWSLLGIEVEDLPWFTPGVQRLVCSSGLFGPMGAFQHALEGASVDQLRYTSYAWYCFFLRAVILWVLFWMALSFGFRSLLGTF